MTVVCELSAAAMARALLMPGALRAILHRFPSPTSDTDKLRRSRQRLHTVLLQLPRFALTSQHEEGRV